MLFIYYTLAGAWPERHAEQLYTAGRWRKTRGNSPTNGIMQAAQGGFHHACDEASIVPHAGAVSAVRRVAGFRSDNRLASHLPIPYSLYKR
jgi:hypothetical protein